MITNRSPIYYVVYNDATCWDYTDYVSARECFNARIKLNDSAKLVKVNADESETIVDKYDNNLRFKQHIFLFPLDNI